jgi:hypothetical protein
MFCKLAGLGFRTSPWGWLGAPFGDVVPSAGLSGNTTDGDAWVWLVGFRALLRA